MAIVRSFVETNTVSAAMSQRTARFWPTTTNCKNLSAGFGFLLCLSLVALPLSGQSTDTDGISKVQSSRRVVPAGPRENDSSGVDSVPIETPETAKAPAREPEIQNATRLDGQVEQASFVDSNVTSRFVSPQQFLVKPAETKKPLSAKRLKIETGPVSYRLSDQAAEQEQTPQQILQQLNTPLAARPLARLADFPGATIAADDRFPERNSRAQLGLPPTRGSWVFENDYEMTAQIVPTIRTINYTFWQPNYFSWASPDFYHQPLYFEEENAERYGIYRPRFQNLASAAHFFVSIPFIPYKLGIHHPCERVYSLGYYRPGSCNPAFRQTIPANKRALLYQSLATTGLIFLLP